MAVDIAHCQTRICEDLPKRTTWLYINEEQTDWDFRKARHGILPVNDENLPNLDLKPEWEKLNAFGHADTNTVWYFHLCIDSDDGTVYVLDPEKDSDIGERDLFPINTSIDSFIKTFMAIDYYLRDRIPTPRKLLRSMTDYEPNKSLADWWVEWVTHCMF